MLPKICVCTYVFGDAPYAAYSSKIYREYCNRHGYAFEVTSWPHDMGDDRDPIWGKVKGVRDLMDRYKHILYVDADTYIYDWSRRIESLIDNNYWMVVAPNVKHKKRIWSRGPNMGIFLVNSCVGSKCMMDEWWDVPKTHPEYGWTWPVDQLGFTEVIFKKYRDKIKMVAYYRLNGMDGQFIRHLFRSNYNTEQRTVFLKNEWDKLQKQKGVK